MPVDVIASTAPFDGYRLLVAPMLYMLRPGVAARLKAFAEQGGTVVLTYLSGYVDENDLAFLGGFPGDGLMALAGVWAEELDVLYPADRNAMVTGENALGISGTYAAHTYCEVIHPNPGCEMLATYESDFYAGKPALTYNPVGKGGCYYIAARTDADFLDAFYGALCGRLALRSACDTPLPEGVHATLREGEDGVKNRFFLNWTDARQQVGAITLPPYGWCVEKTE